MSLSDPISDLLTRVRNAIRAGHDSVSIPASNLKKEICRVLKDQGYIADYQLESEPAPGLIRVTLKYLDNRHPVLQGLRRVSRPSLRVFVQANDIRQVRSGLGMCIISTSQGLMTGKEARRQKIGGEVLCEVW